MSLSVFQDEELIEALWYATAPVWSVEDRLELLAGTEAKRAWRAVPANWQHELALTRARLGQRTWEEYSAHRRAISAETAEERRERRLARQRLYDARPERRRADRTRQRARMDAMSVEERRDRWRRSQKACRDRKRERGAS